MACRLWARGADLTSTWWPGLVVAHLEHSTRLTIAAHKNCSRYVLVAQTVPGHCCPVGSAAACWCWRFSMWVPQSLQQVSRGLQGSGCGKRHANAGGVPNISVGRRGSWSARRSPMSTWWFPGCDSLPLDGYKDQDASSCRGPHSYNTPCYKRCCHRLQRQGIAGVCQWCKTPCCHEGPLIVSMH